MRIGKTSFYGLFALLYVARCGASKPVRGKEIAQAYGIPVEYMLKILQLLARGDILKSTRGRTGGFLLSRSPGAISLCEILDVLEPATELTELMEEAVPGHEGVKSFLSGLHDDAVAILRKSLKRVSLQRLAEIDQS